MIGVPGISATILGVLAALCCACSWAVAAILLKKLGDSLHPMAMTLAKGLLSIVFLGLILLLIGSDAIPARDWGWLAASGVVGIAVGDTLFFMALREIGAQLLVLLFMAGQGLTALLAVAILGERLTATGWIGAALVIGGVGFILWSNLAEPGPATRMKGIVLGILSVLCMSISTVVAKKGLGTDAWGIQATLIRMMAATAGVAFVGLLGGQLREWARAFRNLRIAGLFSLVVVIVTFGGFWLSLVAIKYAGVLVGNTLISTEPVFVLPLSAIFLGEKIAVPAVFGAAIAMVGVGLLCAT